MASEVNSAVQLAFLFVFMESVAVFFWLESVETGHVGGSGSDKLPVGWKICPDQSPPELR